MLYSEFKPDSLLFVGINPSFDSKAVLRVGKGTEFEERLNTEEAVRNYFSFVPGITEEQISDFQLIQQYHRDKLNYFSRHRKLLDDLNNTFGEH